MGHSSHIYIGPHFECKHNGELLKVEKKIKCCTNKGCKDFHVEKNDNGIGTYCDRCGNKKEKNVTVKHFDANTKINSNLFKLPPYNFPFKCINKEIEANWRNRSHIWIIKSELHGGDYIFSGYNKEFFPDSIYEELKEVKNKYGSDIFALESFYGADNVELKYGLYFWEEYNHEDYD